jgi:zinc protease
MSRPYTRSTLVLSLLSAALAAGAGQAYQDNPGQEAPGGPTPPPEVIAPASPRPRLPVLKTTLSNGLRIYSRTNDASEIVSVVCIVRAGLADEKEEHAGLAALTAECLLKGTTTRSLRQFEQAVAAAGGNLRTLPGFDFTEISVVTTREQFEPALKLIGDVVCHPRFEAQDVLEAKDALKRRGASLQDDFTGASYQSLCAQLYPSKPYGRAINGNAQTLDPITAADVRRFWETNYVQNRMVVAVVGDVDAANGLGVAQKAFQDARFEPGAVTQPPGSEVLKQPRLEVIQRDGPAAQLMVGFLAPAPTRDTYPVYAVMDAVVGGGKRARMFQNIREKHSLGYEMGSFYQPLAFQSHLVGYVVAPPFRRNPRTEQVESVMDLVREHLLDQYRTLATTGPTDAELARARNYVLGRYALRQERSREQAKWLAWNVQMGLGPDFDQFFNQRVPLVTKEQVQAAAKRIVTQYALVVTVPDEK